MNIRNEKNTKGITLVALVVTIIVLLILAGITINTLFSDNGIIKKAQEAANKMNQAQQDDLQGLQNLADELANYMDGSEQNPTPPSSSDGSFSEEKGVNTPFLGEGMTPIKWDETANSGAGDWVNTTGNDKNWYDYTTTAKKWANAKTSDGSMWVWIPRYAYQIASNYHTNSTTGGTINIKFLKDATNTAADGTSSWDNMSGQEKWNIHPAFNYGQEVSGIWVAKFEASHTGCTTDVSTGENNTNVTTLTLQVKPGVTSWRNITVGNIYTVCSNYNPSLNSHMIKNIEWGAATYLAQSAYGRNSEVWINNSSKFITGSSGNSVSANADIGTTNDYTSSQGVQASTTGNVTGIYDMSGGAHERMASYVNNSYVQDVNSIQYNYGQALIASKINKTKDVYDVDKSADSNENNYIANRNRYGDAVWEISSSAAGGRDSWYADGSNYPRTNDPFFTRGGMYNNATVSGPYYFSWFDSGNAGVNYSFRPVLIIL